MHYNLTDTQYVNMHMYLKLRLYDYVSISICMYMYVYLFKKYCEYMYVVSIKISIKLSTKDYVGTTIKNVLCMLKELYGLIAIWPHVCMYTNHLVHVCMYNMTCKFIKTYYYTAVCS